MEEASRVPDEERVIKAEVGSDLYFSFIGAWRVRRVWEGFSEIVDVDVAVVVGGGAGEWEWSQVLE